MKRREFITTAAYGMGAAWLGSKMTTRALAIPSLTREFNASDPVVLGSTGIRTSLLAMGTGTVGSGHHSHQTALGVKGLSELLLNGHEHGLRVKEIPVRLIYNDPTRHFGGLLDDAAVRLQHYKDVLNAELKRMKTDRASAVVDQPAICSCFCGE